MKIWALLPSIALIPLSAQPAVPDPNAVERLPLRFERPGPDNNQDDAQFVARAPNYTLGLTPTESWFDLRTAPNAKPVRLRTRALNANRQFLIEAEEPLSGTANYFIGSRRAWRTDVAAFGRVRYKQIYPGIDLVFYGASNKLEYDFDVAPYTDPNTIRLEVSGSSAMHLDEAGNLVIATPAGEIRWAKPEVYQTLNGRRHAVPGRFVLVGRRIIAFRVDHYDVALPLVIDPAVSYTTYLGGKGNDTARGIAVDGAGNVYIAGMTNTSNLPTVSAFQPNFGGISANIPSGDGFVAKFSPSGALLYLTYIGGSLDDGVLALAVDSAGNAYVTGATTSIDFPVVNAYQTKFGGMSRVPGNGTGDAFVAKLNPSGNKLLYSTYLGGNLDDIGMAIALDSSGNAYIGGSTTSTNFPLSAGALQTRMVGAGGEPIQYCCNAPGWDSGDGFVAKLDPTGSQLLFSTYLGGSQDDAILSLAVDSSNNVYVSGCTLSFDFPTTAGAYQRAFGGIDGQNPFFNFGDGFIAKLNPMGTRLIYSTLFGGPGDDCVSAIAVDGSNNVYMTGSTSSQHLTTSSGAFQSSYAGYTFLPLNMNQLYGDAFVAKLNASGSGLAYLSYLGGSTNDAATAIAIDANGDAYVAGFTDSPDFPVTSTAIQSKIGGDGGNDIYRPAGDAFLAVVNPGGTALLYSSYLGGNQDDGALGVAIDGQGNVFVTGQTVSSNLAVTSGAIQKSYGGASANGSTILKGDVFFSAFSGFPSAPPVITSVTNAFDSTNSVLAPNTWAAVKGSHLAPDQRIWQNSDFVASQMPVALDGAGVTLNGKKAFVYYISSTQINILTPPDLGNGPVQVVVSNNGFSSQPFGVQAQQYSLAFFVFNGGPYVIATHLDGSIVGSTSLFPGASSPAHAGETIIVYGNGFGPTTNPVVSGSSTQSGTLTGPLQLQIGGTNATVGFAGLVSPGLYQFNVTIPSGTPAEDNAIKLLYGGQITQSGTLLTIQ